ncbi:Hypothetical protein FKW44_025355, partial [Caligus rogercresseyi]
TGLSDHYGLITTFDLGAMHLKHKRRWKLNHELLNDHGVDESIISRIETVKSKVKMETTFLLKCKIYSVKLKIFVEMP